LFAACVGIGIVRRLTATLSDRARVRSRSVARSGARRIEAIIERLDAELVPGALEAAASHLGLGAQVVEKLGAAGVRAGKRLDTKALIRLARSLRSRRSPRCRLERKGLIAAIVELWRRTFT
jgi:hypothetical protein